VSRFSGVKPGSTAISDEKLRSRRPAPMVRVTANATSATTRAARVR